MSDKFTAARAPHGQSWRVLRDNIERIDPLVVGLNLSEAQATAVAAALTALADRPPGSAAPAASEHASPGILYDTHGVNTSDVVRVMGHAPGDVDSHRRVRVHAPLPGIVRFVQVQHTTTYGVPAIHSFMVWRLGDHEIQTQVTADELAALRACEPQLAYLKTLEKELWAEEWRVLLSKRHSTDDDVLTLSQDAETAAEQRRYWRRLGIPAWDTRQSVRRSKLDAGRETWIQRLRFEVQSQFTSASASE